MSFNLYFAGWGSKDADAYLRELNVHRLMSQVNERNNIESWVADGLSDRLFIDSGAFSVAHSNAKVDIDLYIDYINNHLDIPNWAELDVIPYPVLNADTAKKCSEESWNNYVYMRERVNPKTHILPLYHFGEPKSGLKRILNTKVDGKLVDYIGVGGRHGVATDVQIRYFNEIFAIIKASDNPNVKVHAFGITVPKILENFPFYSADSTTWLQVAINGMILTKSLSTVLISDGTKSDKSNLQNMPEEAQNLILAEVRYFDYDFKALCNDYKLRLRYNIDVLVDWANNYQYKGPETFKSHKLF